MTVSDLCRYEEATQFIQSVDEPKLRAALEYALATVVMRRGMSSGIAAAAQFDLRYYLEAVKAMFENDAVVRAILDGNHEELRW